MYHNDVYTLILLYNVNYLNNPELIVDMGWIAAYINAAFFGGSPLERVVVGQSRVNFVYPDDRVTRKEVATCEDFS